jgi:hypothetical protein
MRASVSKTAIASLAALTLAFGVLSPVTSASAMGGGTWHRGGSVHGGSHGGGWHGGGRGGGPGWGVGLGLGALAAGAAIASAPYYNGYGPGYYSYAPGYYTNGPTYYGPYGSGCAPGQSMYNGC